MVDLSTITVDNILYNIKDAVARSLLGGKQATLVSGQNIKTINNQSILGSGNIDIDQNVPTAEDVSYDNTYSGLEAYNVQDAIDEINDDVGLNTDIIYNLDSEIQAAKQLIPSIASSTNKLVSQSEMTAAIPTDAAELAYDNTESGLAATDVQAAIDELAADLDSKADKSDVDPINVSENILRFDNIPLTDTDKGISYSMEDNVVTLDGTATSPIPLLFPIKNPIPAGNYKINVMWKNWSVVHAPSTSIMSDRYATAFLSITLGNSQNSAYNTTFIGNFLSLYIPAGQVYTNTQFSFCISENDIHVRELSGFAGGYFASPYKWQLSDRMMESFPINTITPRWKDKNVLVCGDSLTQAGVWQTKLASLLNMNVTTHALGGTTIVQIIDGATTGSGTLSPLSAQDVTGKDLIIFFGGTNNMSMSHGQVGDLYPTDNTVCGQIKYAINTIFSLLETAGNLTCRVMFVTPYCFGASPYNDTAYEVDGKGLAQSIEDTAHYDGLPCFNAYKNSGINKFTWNVFSASPTPMTGETVNDQLHLNAIGYKHLGELIARFVETAG